MMRVLSRDGFCRVLEDFGTTAEGVGNCKSAVQRATDRKAVRDEECADWRRDFLSKECDLWRSEFSECPEWPAHRYHANASGTCFGDRFGA